MNIDFVSALDKFMMSCDDVIMMQNQYNYTYILQFINQHSTSYILLPNAIQCNLFADSQTFIHDETFGLCMFDDLPRFMPNIAPRHAPSFGQEVCGCKAVQEVEGGVVCLHSFSSYRQPRFVRPSISLCSVFAVFVWFLISLNTDPCETKFPPHAYRVYTKDHQCFETSFEIGLTYV